MTEFREEILHGKNSRFRYFRFKYALKHNESVPTKKISAKFLDSLIFFAILAMLAKNDRIPGKNNGENFLISRFLV